MRAFLLVAVVAAATMASSFGQYSARTLTRRIAPQVRPAPAPVRPNPAPQPPAQAAPAPVIQPQYRAVAPVVTARPAPVDPAKAAATKTKNDEKQFDYFKRRAEEGSDHAQYELGVRYLTGRGVAPDEKMGREWLSKAAKNGNTQAARKLEELGPEGSAPKPVVLEKPAQSKAEETK